MSNAFTNFLSGMSDGIFGTSAQLKDFQHADRLYVRNTYARAPKVGFLYFVSFNINRNAVKDVVWAGRDMTTVGLLVKKLDLPKFSIATEVVNQYNRKTVVQTKLSYSPISIDFHDDNSDITNNLWKNYYKYYFADSNYGASSKQTPVEFGDTKYGIKNNAYGLNNGQSVPFFTSIDIYVMHQQKFTQITLINPIVTEWTHDSLDQSDGAKTLANKMQVAYEDVVYNAGRIKGSAEASAFTAVYYDKSPSPLSVGGNGTNSLFGAGGVIAGVDSVFGQLDSGNYLGAAITAATTLKNAKNINLKQEGYSIVSGVLGNIQATGNQPGGVIGALGSGLAQSSIGQSGNFGVNLFSGLNYSVNGTTLAQPSKLTGK
jgi:hypothetical protein